MKDTELKQMIFEVLVFRTLEKDNFEMFQYLFNEFPERIDLLVDKIKKNIENIKIPEEAEEEKKAQWEKLCIKIKEIYGDDII